jgi:hypothetical protein
MHVEQAAALLESILFPKNNPALSRYPAPKSALPLAVYFQEKVYTAS